MKPQELLLIAVGFVLWLKYEQQNESPDKAESLEDALMTKVDEATAAVNEAMGISSPVVGMVASEKLLAMLKKRERLSLTRYNLGDGGYTWGYGHFEKKPDALPMQITREFAENLFANDV